MFEYDKTVPTEADSGNYRSSHEVDFSGAIGITNPPDVRLDYTPLTDTWDDATHLDNPGYIASSCDTLHHVVLTSHRPTRPN